MTYCCTHSSVSDSAHSRVASSCSRWDPQLDNGTLRDPQVDRGTLKDPQLDNGTLRNPQLDNGTLRDPQLDNGACRDPQLDNVQCKTMEYLYQPPPPSKLIYVEEKEERLEELRPWMTPRQQHLLDTTGPIHI